MHEFMRTQGNLHSTVYASIMFNQPFSVHAALKSPFRQPYCYIACLLEMLFTHKLALLLVVINVAKWVV